MKYRVLVYPNITYARNLEADSYIVAVRSMIQNLLAVRDDLHFTMLLPKPVESLNIDGVDQVLYDLPTYPNTMRCHFDTKAFIDAIEWKRKSYDIVWSHLPEHTLAIRNVFDNVTNEKPVIVGYCHWFEVPENTAYASTMLWHNLAGVLAMEECGVNSAWLCDLVLRHADGMLDHVPAEQLRRTLTVQYLGTDLPNIKVEPEPGLIVFNHRANEYTGFKWACDAFDALWAVRQDFRVMFTIADVPDRPWVRHMAATDSRESYLMTLGQASLGVGCFRKYSAWSVSVMDGFGVGVPYVLPRGFCYPEMVGDDWPLLYDGRDEFLARVESVLDNPTWRPTLSGIAQSIADKFVWPERIGTYSGMFDRAIADLPMLKSATESYERIADMARNGSTKADIMRGLGWGVGIPWTPYRTRLRVDGIDLRDNHEQLALV